MHRCLCARAVRQRRHVCRRPIAVSLTRVNRDKRAAAERSILCSPRAGRPPGADVAMFDRFTDRARDALAIARPRTADLPKSCGSSQLRG